MKTKKLKNTRELIAIIPVLILAILALIIFVILTPFLWFGNDSSIQETFEDLIK